MLNVISPLEPIAVLTHDFRSHSPLYSWPMVPAEDLLQGEVLAKKLFGSLAGNVRSPRHPFGARWRDPNFFRKSEQDKPPTGIQFLAHFGVAPYELTQSNILSDEMLKLDSAMLRLELVHDEEIGFRLNAIVLEITDQLWPPRGGFSSCWRGTEVNSLDLSLQFDAPSTRLGPFRFHIQGRLPRRFNERMEIEKEHVEFTASGGAMPIPDWVNY